MRSEWYVEDVLPLLCQLVVVQEVVDEGGAPAGSNGLMKLRGLPFNAVPDQILQFFSGYDIPKGVGGIFMMLLEGVVVSVGAVMCAIAAVETITALTALMNWFPHFHRAVQLAIALVMVLFTILRY